MCYKLFHTRNIVLLKIYSAAFNDKKIMNFTNSRVVSVKPLLLPFVLSRVSAGFPSPADDYIETSIDLNRELVRHPFATFYVRASGDSMIDAGIRPNATLVVDRAIETKSATL